VWSYFLIKEHAMGSQSNDTETAAYIKKGKGIQPGRVFAKRSSEAKTWKEFKSHLALVQT